ncbi:MAG: YeiH family putative sulfate export transporter [Elainella sp. C42_A2020_010]|nr:YeiH family putative sulfate export transporter [Elainella sp. C42_A2020_010]RNJ70324.1 MAG: YeiH family putative sulfate export transporter [Leptolyngbya sp. IPPAS B-1204]
MKMLFRSNLRRSLSPKLLLNLRDQSIALLPGLMLTALIAAFSLSIEHALTLTFFNPLLISVFVGMAIQNFWGTPSRFRAGIHCSMKRILRLAVILLGLKLSLTEVLAVGPVGLMIVISSSVSTFYLTCWLGRCLHISRKLTHLIAAGTAICGASAVVATNSVIDSSEEDMAYAITAITGFGTCAMLLYPWVPALFQISPQAFGIWCGASIHEVAQVIAAGFQNGVISGEFATITKLSRVLLLIPIVGFLSWENQYSNLNSNKTKHRFKIPVPWFVVFFALLVFVNSLNLVPESVKSLTLSVNQFLLCMSLAAMGLETTLKRLTKIGFKPIYLAAASWLFLSLVSLLMTSFMVS